jgi:phosphohistidine phosphatase SixA
VLRRLVSPLVAALLLVLGAAPALASDAGLLRTLREEDGLTILYRHAIAPGTGDPAGFRLGDCATQRNLSAEGRAQARDIGRALRQARVPVAEVRSSRWCRARDTARLMSVGSVRPTPALDSVFTASDDRAQRQRRQAEQIIRAHADREGVLVLMGHQVNITDLTGVVPVSGEGVVVRVGSSGDLEVVGRLAPPAGG